MRRISANEVLDIVSNQWAGTNEIMQIGCVGKNKALEIKKEIQVQADTNGYFLPKNLVPMEYVIDYFKINIPYLKKVCKE